MTSARASAVEPVGCDEELGLAAGGHDGECEHDRIVRDVAAANVEQPANRVRQRQDDGALTVILESRLQTREILSAAVRAGESDRLER